MEDLEQVVVGSFQGRLVHLRDALGVGVEIVVRLAGGEVELRRADHVAVGQVGLEPFRTDEPEVVVDGVVQRRVGVEDRLVQKLVSGRGRGLPLGGPAAE